MIEHTNKQIAIYSVNILIKNSIMDEGGCVGELNYRS